MKQKYERKINETKSCFFEEINEVDKLSHNDQVKKKTQIFKISSERDDINTNLTDLKSIIKEYFDQLDVINLETKM